MASRNVELFSAETFDPSLSYVMDVVYTRAVPMVSVGFFLLIVIVVGQFPCIKRRSIQNTSKSAHAFFLTLSSILWIATIGAALSAAIVEPQLHSKLKGTNNMFDGVLAITDSVSTVLAQLTDTITTLSHELTVSQVALSASPNYTSAVAISIENLANLKSAILTYNDAASIADRLRSILSDISSPVDMIDMYSMIAIFSLAALSAILATAMLPLAVMQSNNKHRGSCAEKTNAIAAGIVLFIAFAVSAAYLTLSTIGADFCKDPKNNAVATEDLSQTSPVYNYLVGCDPTVTYSDLINVNYIIPNVSTILNTVATHPNCTAGINASIANLASELDSLSSLISCANIRGAFDDTVDYICNGILDAAINMFLTLFITACFLYILYVATRQLPVHPAHGIKAAKEKQEPPSRITKVIKSGNQDGITWKITQVSKNSYALYTSKATHSDFIAYAYWKQLQAKTCNGATPSIIDTHATQEYIVKVYKCNDITLSEYTGTTQ